MRQHFTEFLIIAASSTLKQLRRSPMHQSRCIIITPQNPLARIFTRCPIALSLFILGAAISEIGKTMHDFNKLESDFADV